MQTLTNYPCPDLQLAAPGSGVGLLAAPAAAFGLRPLPARASASPWRNAVINPRATVPPPRSAEAERAGRHACARETKRAI